MRVYKTDGTIENIEDAETINSRLLQLNSVVNAPIPFHPVGVIEQNLEHYRSGEIAVLSKNPQFPGIFGDVAVLTVAQIMNCLEKYLMKMLC